MASRFDASLDKMSRSANLLTRTSFTVMGWFKLTNDRNTYSTFISLDAGDGSGVILQTRSDGTSLKIYTNANSNGSALSTGVWYHMALVGNATNYLAYVNGVLDITAAQYTFTPASLNIGNDDIDEWLDGCAAYVKAWSVDLTVAEIQQEMYVVRPRRALNLYSWTPLLPGATERLRDYSGNGYDWTATGTLADEDGPPISWGASTNISIPIESEPPPETPVARHFRLLLGVGT